MLLLLSDSSLHVSIIVNNECPVIDSVITYYIEHVWIFLTMIWFEAPLSLSYRDLGALLVEVLSIHSFILHVLDTDQWDGLMLRSFIGFDVYLNHI